MSKVNTKIYNFKKKYRKLVNNKLLVHASETVEEADGNLRKLFNIKQSDLLNNSVEFNKNFGLFVDEKNNIKYSPIEKSIKYSEIYFFNNIPIINLRRKLLINPNKWEEITKAYERTFLLFITNKCNLNCPYCFNEPNLYNSDSMSIQYVKDIIYSNPKITKIDLMGGEPLLHPYINEILSFLESEQKHIGLYTNGYFLDKLSQETKFNNLKINISFQSIYSNDKSLKPLSDIKDKINKYSKLYPFKLVFLLSPQNKDILFKVTEYIEMNFKNINKLTIGSVRNEADYFNDNYPYVLSFNKYYTIVQNFIDEYNGKLDIDIFTKGILYTDKLPRGEKFQLNRFKNIFPKNKYISCLFLIANDKKKNFSFNNEIKYDECEKCYRTGLKNCLADKIYLRRKYE